MLGRSLSSNLDLNCSQEELTAACDERRSDQHHSGYMFLFSILFCHFICGHLSLLPQRICAPFASDSNIPRLSTVLCMSAEIT